jgi:hypothetical protein
MEELGKLIEDYYLRQRQISQLEDGLSKVKEQIKTEMASSNLTKYQTGTLVATLTISMRRSINIKEAEVMLDKDTFQKLAKETPVTTFRVLDISKE